MSPTTTHAFSSSGDDEFHYALKSIESIIHEDVPFFLKVRKPLDDELLLGAKAEIETVVESIKTDLATSPLYFKEEKFRADYIQLHQRGLLSLAGSMVMYMGPSPEITNANAEKLIQYIYQALNELLDFIKKHFAKYLSDAWIPLSYQQTVCINITPRVKILRARLAQTNSDPRLISIILAPLENLLASSVKDYTFNEIIYLKEYMYRLLDFLEDKTGDVEECLLLLLYRLDFNCDEFYTYYINRFSKELHDSDTESECIENLMIIQKLLKQTPQYPFLMYRHDQPSLKEQVNTWLNEEIRYYKGRQKANNPEQLAGNPAAIRSSLTVAEIAYVLRIFVKFDILRAKRQLTRIFRFISLYIDTENTSSISVHSLNNEYHKPDAKARENIKNLLKRIIDYIDKDQDLADA